MVRRGWSRGAGSVLKVDGSVVRVRREGPRGRRVEAGRKGRREGQMAPGARSCLAETGAQRGLGDGARRAWLGLRCWSPGERKRGWPRQAWAWGRIQREHSTSKRTGRVQGQGLGLRPGRHAEGLPALLGASSLPHFLLGLSVEHSAKAPESFWINVEANGSPTRTSCVAVGRPRTPQSSVCTPT